MDAFLVPQVDEDVDEQDVDEDSQCDQQDCHGSVRFVLLGGKTVPVRTSSGSQRITKHGKDTFICPWLVNAAGEAKEKQQHENAYGTPVPSTPEKYSGSGSNSSG